MNLGVRREGTVSDDILETQRLTRTDGRDPASICLVARRGGYIANKKMGIWLALFFSVLATVVHAEPTMAEGLFMFMGGESGKSCADEGSRFICNRIHIGDWERNTFAYPTREQMNQVSGLKPNMVSIKGGQRGTYCYTQNLDMKCGSGSPNTLAHWFTVGGADPVKADWTGGGFGSADKKFDYFISLKSNEAGGAFCNDARGSSTIKCDKPTVGKGETFHMLWLSTEESKSADEKAAAEKIAINSGKGDVDANLVYEFTLQSPVAAGHGPEIYEILFDGKAVTKDQVTVHFPAVGRVGHGAEAFMDGNPNTYTTWQDGNKISPGTKFFSITSKKVKEIKIKYHRPKYSPGWTIKENGTPFVTETSNRGTESWPSPVTYTYNS